VPAQVDVVGGAPGPESSRQRGSRPSVRVYVSRRSQTRARGLFLGDAPLMDAFCAVVRICFRTDRGKLLEKFGLKAAQVLQAGATLSPGSEQGRPAREVRRGRQHARVGRADEHLDLRQIETVGGRWPSYEGTLPPRDARTADDSTQCNDGRIRVADGRSPRV